MVRRHPVLFGILILIVIGFVSSMFLYRTGFKGSKARALSSDDKVGVVSVEGMINDSKDVIEQIDSFSEDEKIKAIVVRIESPGGGVAPAQEIFKAILDAKKEKKKKIVVSMGSVAASGGYLIACAGDKIVANDGTLTGSISAVMHHANVEELMKKIGVKASVVKSGKYKDIGSPTREMTEEEKILLQGVVDDIYDQFLETILTNRKITREELVKIADGRVFTGRQALKLGLVDELGGMAYAVRLAGKLSGIKGKPELVHPPKKRSSFFEFLLQEMAQVIARDLKNADVGLEGPKFFYLMNS